MVIVVVLFSDCIEQVLRTPAVIAGALTFGALLMLAAERLGPRTRTEESIGWWEAMLIGCAQASIEGRRIQRVVAEQSGEFHQLSGVLLEVREGKGVA